MSDKIIIEVEDEPIDTGFQMPVFSEGDSHRLSSFLEEILLLHSFARRKIAQNAVSVEPDETQILSLILVLAYLRLLSLRGFIRRMEHEEEVFNLIEQYVFKNGGSDSILPDQVLSILLEPVVELSLDRVHLLHFPIERALKLLNAYDLFAISPDILGDIRQVLMSRPSKKRMGIYHTPLEIVRLITGLLDVEEVTDASFTVLDPACGSGMFLLGAIERIASMYVNRGMPSDAAYMKACGTHILGFDKDRIAVAISKMNILLRSPKGAIAPVPVYNIDPLMVSGDMFANPHISRRLNKGIQFIVGNPPWRQLKREEQRLYRQNYVFAQGSKANLFTVFIEYGMRHLVPGGRLIYLLPDALLNIQSYTPIRKQILASNKLFFIGTCGNIFNGVYAPAAIVGIEKPRKEDSNRSYSIEAIEDVAGQNPRYTKIPVSVFLSDPEAIFNYMYDKQAEEIRESMDKLPVRTYLKDNAAWALGIVTGNNKRFLAKEKISDQYERIIVGKDIDRYVINYSGNWILYDPYELQQTAPRELFAAKEKLVYKFIGKRLKFAYDDSGMLTLNNANVLIPQIKGLSVHYVLAVLNSSAVQFYYYYRYFTVKVLRNRLESIPIPLADAKDMDYISSLAKQAIRRASRGESISELDREIDEELFKLYRIPQHLRPWLLDWLRKRNLNSY